MRYSAMPMRVPLFHSLAELMATMMRYYCHGEVPEAMLSALAASNGLALMNPLMIFIKIIKLR